VAAAHRLEKFQGKLCFQGKRKLLKILNNKKYFKTAKNFRATLFFRASASCSKFLNVKGIFNTVKIFRANLSCSKILNDKNISIQ